MIVIPPGTIVREPDALNRVEVEFRNHADALIFYHFVIGLDGMTATLTPKKENTDHAGPQ